MKFKPLACGFHSHTDASLDGGSTVDAKIKNAAKLGRIADAVTDHGIMSALVPHWSAANKLYKDKKIDTPIKSIHGIEAYIVDPDRPAKVLKNGKVEPKYMHLTIHFKTARAYQYFCKLTPKMEERAIVRYGERKPLLLLEELEPISGEITLGTGCLVGPVQKNFLAGRSDLAEKMYLRLRALAGPGNLFAEIFPHIISHEWKKPERNAKKEIVKAGEFVGATQKRDDDAIDPPFEADPCTGLVDIQKHPNAFVMSLALKYGDPIVISLDDHYACKEDKVVQEARLGNGREDWKFYGCMQEDVKVRMADGSLVRIADVNEGDLVLSFDIKTKRTIAARVIKKMTKQAAKDHFFDFEMKRRYGQPHSLCATPNHYIWTDNGWSKIGESDHGYRLSNLFSDPFKECLDGIMLGDGSISAAGSNKSFFGLSYSHTEKFGNSVKWLANKIDCSWRIKDTSGSFPGARPAVCLAKYDDMFATERSRWYPDGRKKIPHDLKLTPRSVAWWISDDGSRQTVKTRGGKLRKSPTELLKLYTSGFSEQDVDFLVRLLDRDLGIRARRWTDKNKYSIIIVPQGEYRKLSNIVAQFVHPDFKYKLAELCRDTPFCDDSTEFVSKSVSKITLSGAPAISVSKKYNEKFDLQIEGSACFFANDLLVHNSYHSPTTEYCAEQLQKQLGVSDKTIEEWVDNSYQFVDLFKDYKLETSKDRLLLPTTEMVYGINTSSVGKLHELIKLHGRMPPEDSPQYATYKERLDYEISVLTDNKTADFLPYFFVLEDAARYAKSQKIMWNTRGSAGGSLVIYLLGVSITDPIKYDLPFERFLTLGRILSGSLPDIDSDWQDRTVILEYLAKKYGDKMSLIATDMMMRLKTSILDVERSTAGFVSLDTANMCKMIPGAGQGMSDKDWLFGYTNRDTGSHIKGFWEEDKPGSILLREWATKNPVMWQTVQKCIGICKTRGVHPGGVVLTPGPVENYAPLIQMKQGLATAYSMKSAETIGLVKYDFLGVSTLKALGIAMNSLESHTGVPLEWREFDHDPRVYSEIIAKDLLTGIFQMSGGAVRAVAKQINPKNIRDIALWISLRRPGAMDAPSPDPKDPVTVTASDYYIMCAQGRREPYYIHEDLKGILGDTYGVIVTQEQGLKLFRVLADYTYEMAEVVRRAIGKKEKDLLSVHSSILKQKCIARGWTEAQAQKLYESIEASARYSFNMAHAVAYAIVGYNGCWLKLNHPVHYWKGELTVHSDDHDKLREYLTECRDMILEIDIMKSDPVEWIVEGDKLRPPLSLMKGAGTNNTANIKRVISGAWDQISEAVDPPEEEADAVG